MRFYGELTPAKTPGEMAGARLVREWNPATGAQRTWYETLDHNGVIRIVRPETEGPRSTTRSTPMATTLGPDDGAHPRDGPRMAATTRG